MTPQEVAKDRPGPDDLEFVVVLVAVDRVGLWPGPNEEGGSVEEIARWFIEEYPSPLGGLLDVIDHPKAAFRMKIRRGADPFGDRAATVRAQFIDGEWKYE